MESKRGEDTQRKLFKEIFLKRVYYLKNKRIIKEQEVYNLVKDFFKEFLSIDYEFTEDELKGELNRVYMEDETKKKVNALLNDVFKIQYAESPLSEDALRKIIGEFGHLVNVLVTEHPHHHLLRRLFHKLFRRHHGKQEEEKKEMPFFDARNDGRIRETIAAREAEPKREEPPEPKKDVALKDVVENVEPISLDWIHAEEDAEKKGPKASDWTGRAPPPTKKKKGLKGKAAKKSAKGAKKMRPVPQEPLDKAPSSKKPSSKTPLSKKTSPKKSAVKSASPVAAKDQPQKKDSPPPIPAPPPLPIIVKQEPAAPADPKERMDELLGKIKAALPDVKEAKRLYNQLHLIYKNVPDEVKTAYFQRLHESYRRIKESTPAS